MWKWLAALDPRADSGKTPRNGARGGRPKKKEGKLCWTRPLLLLLLFDCSTSTSALFYFVLLLLLLLRCSNLHRVQRSSPVRSAQDLGEEVARGAAIDQGGGDEWVCCGGAVLVGVDAELEALQLAAVRLWGGG